MKSRKLSTLLLIIVLFVSSLPSMAFASENKKFKDVQSTYWANEYIQVLVNNGILSGYSNGNFAPEKGITREEFAVVLFKTFGLDEAKPSTPSFKDVDASRWSYGYIEAAKPYLTGYFPPNGKPTFDPEGQASREDVAVALVRALNLDAIGSSASIDKLNFSDIADISPNLRDEVALAVNNHLISGFPNGTLQPSASITRAQASAMVYKVIKSTFSKANVTYSAEVKMPEQVSSNVVPINIKLPANTKLVINEKTIEYTGTNYSGNWKISEGPGTYTFKINLQYPNSKVETITRQVVFTAGAPVITMIDTISEKVSQSKLLVKFNVKDPNGSALSLVNVNGTAVTKGYFNDYYSTTLQLKEGYNDILIEAKNQLGLVTTKSIRVLYEVSTPTISIINIPATSNKANINIDLKVSDPVDSTLYLYVNELKYKITNNKAVTIPYKLIKGENVITFKVVNSQNKMSTVSKTVVYQTVAPAITFTSPATSTKAAYSLELKVTDTLYKSQYLAVKVNEKSALVNSDGTVSYPVTLISGKNLITVEVSNPDGKVTKTDFTVTYTPSAPPITFSDIQTNTSGAAVTISGNLYGGEDTTAVVLKIKGEVVAITPSGNFTKTLPLLAGDNVILIQATNRSGITTEVTKIIKYAPPVNQ